MATLPEIDRSAPARHTTIWSTWQGRNPYRDLPDAALAAEVEELLRDRAELIENLALGQFDPDANETPDTVANGIALVDYDLGEAERERARRRRLERFGGPKGSDPRSVSLASRFDAVRSLDLVDVVERIAGVSFRKAGKEWLAHCPFPDHPDPDPSFSVNRERAVWHCFGCGRGGDVVGFAQHWFGAIHRVEALQQIEYALGKAGAK